MSLKPSDTARFAVDGSDVDAVNIAAPSSGLRDTGYPDNGIPTAKNFNYLENLAYRWRQYLSDGNFQGATTFDNTVGIGGNTSVGLPLVVADFVFTADNTTDTLTKTAHGLLTGDGPVRVSNSGGGLPGGLVVATDYWVIKTGTDTFKLATTLANALNTSPINITTNGTGTQTLSDTAGTLRSANATIDGNTTINGGLTVLGSYGAVAATSVVTGTLDATGLITGTSGATITGAVQATLFRSIGSDQILMHPWAFQPQNGGAANPFLDDRGSLGNAEGWTHWTGGSVVAWLPLKTSDKIQSVAFVYDKVGSAAGLTMEIVSSPFSVITSALTVVDSFVDTSSASGLVSHSLTPNYTISSTEGIGIRVTSATASHFFLNAQVTWNHP